MPGEHDKHEGTAPPQRKRWAVPRVIVSEARAAEKLQSTAIGYEYHETAPGGGGTTNIS
jgi:hypothetical protein